MLDKKERIEKKESVVRNGKEYDDHFDIAFTNWYFAFINSLRQNQYELKEGGTWKLGHSLIFTTFCFFVRIVWVVLLPK